MNTTITCLVVDDDEIDRLTTVSFLKDYPHIQILGQYANPLTALDAAQQLQPDVLFLDIDMPEMSGLDVRRQLMQVPACVFITAYPDYAVESFELAALDFLVKPHQASRFAKTIERVNAYLQIRKQAALLEHTLGADSLFIKDGHHHVKIQLHEILYLEALKDYTGIITAQKKHVVLSSLGNLLNEPSFSSFIRVHRSYAIQKNFIQKITATEVVVNEVVLPIGRAYRNTLKAIIA
jgi:DNA-binding LytR/AlgR family response regulator